MTLWHNRLLRAMSVFARLTAWALLVVGLILGMAWAGLHFWIVPRIGDFRPQLETLARQSLGVPVRIGVLSAHSSGWVPSFELRDIALLDAQGQTAMRLPKVVVAISLRSVLRLRLDQLVLDAPELDVHEDAQGRWQVAGLDWTPGTAGDSAAADWLFTQREVIIRGGTLRWRRDAAPPLDLRQVDLVLRNSARHHDLRVDATPPVEWGARFVGMGRFKRGLLSTHPGRWTDWSGQVYAHFPQLNLAAWRKHLPQSQVLTQVIQTGHGAFRLWSDIDKGQWTGGMADMDLRALSAQWVADRAPLQLQKISGRLGSQVLTHGFSAFTRDLTVLDDQGRAWPHLNLALNYTRPQGQWPAKGHIQADKLDLANLRDLMLRLPLSPDWHKPLQTQTMGGQVQALQWRWQGDWQAPAQYEAQLSVNNLMWRDESIATSDHQPWPGVQGADLKLAMTQTGGRVDLHMNKPGQLFLPGILAPTEVPLSQLQATAQWEKKTTPEGATWQVPQWQVKLANADLQGEWHGQWRQGTTPMGWLDLQGQIQQASAASAHRYLPLRLPESVRHYVRDALSKGRYTGVKVKIKGDLAQLPFNTSPGSELMLTGRLQDVDFDPVPAALLAKNSPPWPRLRGLQGQLSFDRTGMKLSKASARLGDAKTGAQLINASADIADMVHNPVLQVNAEGKSSAAQLLGLVQQSPLDHLLSGALHDTQANGSTQWRLKLGLPLLALQKSQVQGTVVLPGNDVRMTPDTPWLEKVQGTLQFSESGFGLNGIKGRLLGGPISIEGGLRVNGNAPALAFQAQGQISAEGLRSAQAFLPSGELGQRVEGTTAYTARLAWRGGQPELLVQSSLNGLAMDLPAPLGKTASTSMPLWLQIKPQDPNTPDVQQVQFKLGEVAAAHYVRDTSDHQHRVIRGSLALGLPTAQLPDLPASGVAAWVNMAQLNVDDWLALSPNTASQNHPNSNHPVANPTEPPYGHSTWLNYLPTQLALQSEALTADGRTLHQVVAGATREGTQWLASIDAQELSGQVTYRPSVNRQPGLLFARLSRLNLPPSSAKDVEALLAAPPAHLPALDIVIDAVELRGKKLGRVDIEAINTEPQRGSLTPGAEWQLKKFDITLPEGQLRSTGRWLAEHPGSPLRKTEMNFLLDVKNAGDLLTRLGTPGALRGGTGQLEGHISWQGSPLALHYPSMDGRFDVRMGRGQFLKADAGAAKLLGVLSLQALPRRLLLDFRDVFSEGFAFDSVRGEVSIRHGMASTRNLQIQGVNAVVQLDGSADIARETQQLRVVILPEVDAGTASLLAGIAVNPVVGVTTFLAQLFLQNPLSRASTQEFLIDGTWTDPRVTRVDLRGRSGTNPSATP